MPNASRLRHLLLLLPLSLAGCELGTEAVSLNVQFVANHELNEDGSCTVQFVAQAFGFGTLHWDRVTIRQGTSVVAEYTGAETAEYWGAAQIRAGETQASDPFVAPDGAAGTQVELQYRAGDSSRSTTLAPTCSA